MSSDCMIPGSDEYRLDELDELIAKERVSLQVLTLREKALRDKIDRYEVERKNLCPHTLTVQTSSYSGGGYDYTGRTFYSVRCKRCDKVLKTWDKSDGCYG